MLTPAIEREMFKRPLCHSEHSATRYVRHDTACPSAHHYIIEELFATEVGESSTATAGLTPSSAIRVSWHQASLGSSSLVMSLSVRRKTVPPSGLGSAQR
jgi:hypothetical protein